MRLFRALIIAAVLIAVCSTAFAEPAGKPHALVLYPDVPPPYNIVFSSIVSGIQEHSHFDVSTRVVPKKYDRSQLSSFADSTSPDVIIALGQRALTAAGDLDRSVPIVASAIDTLPARPAHSAVSMHIDPKHSLRVLKQLLPNVSRIIVVHDPKRTIALVPAINNAARSLDLAIELIPVDDAKQVIDQSSKVLSSANKKDTAVWYLRGSIEMNPQVIFPFVLKRSWQFNIPVFSNSLAHAKQGFLFAVSPDYRGQGIQVAELSRKQLVSPRPLPTVELLSATQSALNQRTAAHVGVRVPGSVVRGFDLLFPSK